MNYVSVSKTMSYALRHKPEEFGLSLDEQGWVLVNKMIEGLKKHSAECKDLSLSVVEKIVKEDSKKRYELSGGKIRAVYGHSTAQKIFKSPSEPPNILYHGTTPNVVEVVKQTGLKPMSRQYVHLSEDTDTAIVVAKRRTNSPVILKVRAKDAFRNGIMFYQESTGIWLSDAIPAKYIMFE